jgi:hypothetical protein
MSVIINTTGHSKTPAVKLKEKLSPKNLRFKGSIPIVFSSENILVPTNSAINALAINNPARIMNSLVGLWLIILFSIEVVDVKDL